MKINRSEIHTSKIEVNDNFTLSSSGEEDDVIKEVDTIYENVKMENYASPVVENIFEDV